MLRCFGYLVIGLLFVVLRRLFVFGYLITFDCDCGWVWGGVVWFRCLWIWGLQAFVCGLVY